MSFKGTYTSREICALLSINLRTLYRKIDKNEIPFFRIGPTGAFRFPKDKVIAWMNGQLKDSTK